MEAFFADAGGSGSAAGGQRARSWTDRVGRAQSDRLLAPVKPAAGGKRCSAADLYRLARQSGESERPFRDHTVKLFASTSCFGYLPAEGSPAAARRLFTS